jgi:hypothetical protein
MSKRDADNSFAEVTIATLRRQPTSHPAVHVPAIEEVLFNLSQVLTTKENNALSSSEYKDLRVAAAIKAGQKSEKSFAEIDRILFEDYQILSRKDEVVSITTDMPPPALAGTTILRENRSRWRYLLAHQHALAFPELVEIMELFAPPGKPASAAQSRRDHFIFWRKLNQVTVDYAVDELREFRVLERTPENTLCAVWAPPPILCILTVKHYLALTNFEVDVAIATDELLSQVSSTLPPRLFEAHPATSAWMRTLRAPPDTIIGEVGGSRIRLTTQGLHWLAAAGLVSPLDCGKVLRQRRARDALINLRDALIERMARLSPTNRQMIEDALRPI